MGRFRLPDKDIKYGIRNVDYGEYLEFRSDHSNVAMRPKKDDKMQHVCRMVYFPEDYYY